MALVAVATQRPDKSSHHSILLTRVVKGRLPLASKSMSLDTSAVTPIFIPPLVLRSGTRIERVLETALEFVEQDGSYRTYDLAPVKQDNVLTEADIRVANAMVARMSQHVIGGIYAQASVINAALSQVPGSATLAAPEDSIPWQRLEELMAAMQGIPEVKLARQTKVLHKKRPALIPILDSVVETYLRRVHAPRRTGDPGRDAVELIRSYKHELDATLSALRALQEELHRRGIDLTECRLLDLFLWGYSGTYTPLYLRTQLAVPIGTPAPYRKSLPLSAASSDLKGHVSGSIDVEIFRDDDTGYLAWLASHPAGFVLNVARVPRPNYLKLHQATCRTISGRPPRGGPWTGPYVKVCADDQLQVAGWTGQQVGAAPTLCGVCLQRR